MTPWYENWFADELYIEVYSHRDANEARQAVDLFIAGTGLAAPARVLDLACGTGRHAFEFARRGFNICAADLSPTLLAVAHRKTRSFSGSVKLTRADMRHVPFRRAFDGVAQLFTAFGYFQNESEDAAVLHEVASVLRPGGWYLLDFFNEREVRASLRDTSERVIPGGRVLEHRSIRAGRIEKDICIELEGGPRVYHESVRLYTRDELVRMFREAGLHVTDTYGDYSGNAFRADSPRCILTAQLQRS